jgi:hypothetical protein
LNTISHLKKTLIVCFTGHLAVDFFRGYPIIFQGMKVGVLHLTYKTQYRLAGLISNHWPTLDNFSQKNKKVPEIITYLELEPKKSGITEFFKNLSFIPWYFQYFSKIHLEYPRRFTCCGIFKFGFVFSTNKKTCFCFEIRNQTVLFCFFFHLHAPCRY